MLRILVPLALLGALIVACGGGDASGGNAAITPAPSPPAGCAPARPHAAGESLERIEGGGGTRTYILHVPPAYDGSTPLPLVLAFHPFGADARTFDDYTALPAMADKSGFVLVSPEGTGAAGAQHWNVTGALNDADDLGFVRDLLASLDAALCVDPARTYATGYSNGGGMVQRLACEMPDRFAAVGVVASVYVSCTAKVPVVAFHGTADPVLPFEGGAVAPDVVGGTYPPVRRVLSEWARALGCDGLPIISQPAASIELSTFRNCPSGDGQALLYAVIGGGHTWPNATRDLDLEGPTTHQIDATATIWEFFAAHARIALRR
jgi:polyhydroxybutyrate depolymerase